MEETLYLKFTQHPDLKRELLATGNGELVEVCTGQLDLVLSTEDLMIS